MLKNKNWQNVILFVVCLSCASCTQKIEYIYEDITITRIEHEGYSMYYCNNSSSDCAIKVTGSQNFYRAYLVIDKITKKVWLVPIDCLMEQKNIDHKHFQADYCSGDSINVRRLPYHCADNTESQYECYALLGVRSYSVFEIDETQELFPITKIRAKYGYNNKHQYL